MPPICARMPLLRRTLRQLGFPNGRQLYEALRPTLFWPGMQQDSIEVSARARPRQIEAARFLEPPYLLPTEKGGEPFAVWCIDTIVRLQPVSPDGCAHIIVAVCAFTKWVEAAAVRNVDSATTARFLHEHIICRYGVPGIVRTDRGVEYRGRFDRYLGELGVSHRLISTMHPRANG